MACKFCPEIVIGEKGHLVRTCCGYKHCARNQVHEWIQGGLNDIIVPVETFYPYNMFQDIIKHNQRFDYYCIPAVVELCWQAGADPYDEKFSQVIGTCKMSLAVFMELSLCHLMVLPL